MTAVFVQLLVLGLALASCLATHADRSERRSSRSAGSFRSSGPERRVHSSESERVANETVQNAFTSIYDSKFWTAAGNGSGSGSTREITTAAISAIRLVANTYGLRTMIDAPCGAFVWQPLLLRLLEDDFSDFKFLGLDIVPSVVKANSERHADKSNWQFQVKDLSSERIPSGYDLLLSRDALQHLPCTTVVESLETIAESEPRYLLLGSYSEGSFNQNINLGDYFQIDLRAPPFNMGEGVLRIFQEHTTMVDANEPNKELLLFSGKYMQTLDFAAMRSGCALLPTKNA